MTEFIISMAPYNLYCCYFQDEARTNGPSYPLVLPRAADCQIARLVQSREIISFFRCSSIQRKRASHLLSLSLPLFMAYKPEPSPNSNWKMSRNALKYSPITHITPSLPSYNLAPFLRLKLCCRTAEVPTLKVRGRGGGQIADFNLDKPLLRMYATPQSLSQGAQGDKLTWITLQQRVIPLGVNDTKA